jgi:hypothetical protein
MPEEVPMIGQERVYISPVWYTGYCWDDSDVEGDTE